MKVRAAWAFGQSDEEEITIQVNAFTKQKYYVWWSEWIDCDIDLDTQSMLITSQSPVLLIIKEHSV